MAEMRSTSFSKPANWSTIVLTFLALIAVMGLSGSTFPQAYTTQTLPQYHPVTGAGVSVTAGSSVLFPQIIAKTTTIENSAYEASAFGAQQLQQSIRQDSEGALYEDGRSRRSHVLICIEIAKRLSSEPLALTNIALLVRINFSQARKCLENMMVAGLVQPDQTRGERKYTLTKKGMLFLESGEVTLKLFQPQSIGSQSPLVADESQVRTIRTH